MFFSVICEWLHILVYRKTNLDGPYCTVGAIKMRGSDIMRAGKRLWRVMEGDSTRRDVHSFLGGHFLTNSTICQCVMLKSGLGTSNCNQWWHQVGQVHMNIYINKIKQLGEKSNSVDVLTLQPLLLLRGRWFCPCQASLCTPEDRCTCWGLSARLLPPDSEKQTSPTPSNHIMFIPGINCLHSVTVTSGVCSVNQLLGETSLCTFTLFAILLRF